MSFLISSSRSCRFVVRILAIFSMVLTPRSRAEKSCSMVPSLFFHSKRIVFCAVGSTFFLSFLAYPILPRLIFLGGLSLEAFLICGSSLAITSLAAMYFLVMSSPLYIVLKCSHFGEYGHPMQPIPGLGLRLLSSVLIARVISLSQACRVWASSWTIISLWKLHLSLRFEISSIMISG